MTDMGMQILQHHDLTAKEARAVTERIKSKMGDLMSDIAKASVGRAHLALGYDSWEEYVKEEFGHAPLHLPRAERKAVSRVLKGQGMSLRAIAAATGVTHPTVINDLAGGQNLPPEPVPVIGRDGKSYPPTCTIPKTTPPTPVGGEEMLQPASSRTTTCPTCGGTGKVYHNEETTSPQT